VCSLLLYDFCSKAEVRRPLDGQVVHAQAEVLPLIPTPLAKRKKWGASVSRAPCVVGVRGHRRKSVKAVADRLLVDVEVGASGELLLLNKQSFRDGRYSSSTGMEELEWQIMLQ
jgi:hypothetical protein